MKELFVDYNTSLELKRLGFNKDCFATFDEDKNFELQDFFQNYETFPFHIISAPLKYQVFEWFREKYEFFVNYQGDCRNSYFDIVKDGVVLACINRKTYKEAETECINQLILLANEKI